MAVPPLAAKVIIDAILKTFAGIDYPTITPKWQMAQSSVTDYKQLRLLEQTGCYLT